MHIVMRLLGFSTATLKLLLKKKKNKKKEKELSDVPIGHWSLL